MKIWIQKFAIYIEEVLKLNLSNPAKLSCLLFFLKAINFISLDDILSESIFLPCANIKVKEISQPFKIKNPFWQIRLFFVVCLRNRLSEMITANFLHETRSLFHQFFTFQQNAKLEGKEEKTDFCKIHVKSMESKPFWSCNFVFSTRKVNCQDWKHFDCC